MLEFQVWGRRRCDVKFSEQRKESTRGEEDVMRMQEAGPEFVFL